MKYRVHKTVKLGKGLWIKADTSLHDLFFQENLLDVDDLIKKGYISRREETEAPKKKESPKVTHTSPWTLDPEALKDKHLDVLNILVHERDPKLSPYETPEEAIAKLSADFNGS